MAKVSKSTKAAATPKGDEKVAKKGRGRPCKDAPAEVKVPKRPSGVVKKASPAKKPKNADQAKVQKRGNGASKTVEKTNPKTIVKAKAQKSGSKKVEKKKAPTKPKKNAQASSRTTPKDGKGGRVSKKAAKKRSPKSSAAKGDRNSKKATKKQAPATPPAPTANVRMTRSVIQQVPAVRSTVAETEALINLPAAVDAVQPAHPPTVPADNSAVDAPANAAVDVAQAPVAGEDNAAVDVAPALINPPPAPVVQPSRSMTNAAAYAELLQTLSDYQRQQVDQLRSYIASQREANEAHLQRLRAIVDATEQQ